MKNESFEKNTSFQLCEGDETLYEINVSEEWNIGKVPNGGILLSTLLKVASHAAKNFGFLFCDPISAQVQYLSPTIPNEISYVRVKILKKGKKFANIGLETTQRGRVSVQMTCIVGNLNDDNQMFSPVSMVPLDMNLDETKMFPLSPSFGVIHNLFKNIDAFINLSSFSGKEYLTSKVYFWGCNNETYCDELDVFMAAAASDFLPPKVEYLYKVINFVTSGNPLPLKWFPTLSLQINFHQIPTKNDFFIVQSKNLMLGKSSRFETQTIVSDSAGNAIVSCYQMCMEVDFSKNQKNNSKL